MFALLRILSGARTFYRPVLSSVVAILMVPIGASAGAIVGFDPPTCNVTVRESISVEVTVQDVVDLYVFQFDITFDPLVLRAERVSEGSFLAAGGSTFLIFGSIDNTVGAISFAANTLLEVFLE